MDIITITFIINIHLTNFAHCVYMTRANMCFLYLSRNKSTALVFRSTHFNECNMKKTCKNASLTNSLQASWLHHATQASSTGTSLARARNAQIRTRPLLPGCHSKALAMDPYTLTLYRVYLRSLPVTARGIIDPW